MRMPKPIVAALLVVLAAGCSRKVALTPTGASQGGVGNQPSPVTQPTWEYGSTPGPVYQGRPPAHWANELKRADPVARGEAGRALSKLGEDGYPHLRDGLRSRSDEVRLTAIRALPQTVMLAHQNETTPILLSFVRDQNPELRREAVVRLGWYGKDGRGFIPMLRGVMANDAEPKVREAAMVTIDSIEQAVTGVSKVNPQ